MHLMLPIVWGMIVMLPVAAINNAAPGRNYYGGVSLKLVLKMIQLKFLQQKPRHLYRGF
jgi:hypothetical protein